MFGKNKKRLAAARQVIAKFHETIQPYPDNEIGETLDFAEIVRFDMAVSETAREAEEVFEQFFTNPFGMNEAQLHAMLDWCQSIQSQFATAGDGMRLAGLMIWRMNGLCAAHLELLPLGAATWRDLERGKDHTSEFDWQRYSLCLTKFGVLPAPSGLEQPQK